jgi:hypothetical protein
MDSTGLSNRIWIKQRDMYCFMTKPLVDIKEDPTDICDFIGWIQLDKVIAFGLNNGIWIGI